MLGGEHEQTAMPAVDAKKANIAAPVAAAYKISLTDGNVGWVDGWTKDTIIAASKELMKESVPAIGAKHTAAEEADAKHTAAEEADAKHTAAGAIPPPLGAALADTKVPALKTFGDAAAASVHCKPESMTWGDWLRDTSNNTYIQCIARCEKEWRPIVERLLVRNQNKLVGGATLFVAADDVLLPWPESLATRGHGKDHRKVTRIDWMTRFAKKQNLLLEWHPAPKHHDLNIAGIGRPLSAEEEGNAE